MSQIMGRSNTKGSQIADMLMPANGYRGAQSRRGIQPKDHMKENRMSLKYSQAKMREEREIAARRPKDLYKLEQFRDIGARVYEEAPRSPRRSARGADYDDGNNMSFDNASKRSAERSTTGLFLQKGIGAERRAKLLEKNYEARAEIQEKLEDARYIADRPNTPRKGRTPKGNEVAKLAPRNNANFIAENRSKADRLEAPATMTVREKAAQRDSVHENFGKVPSYLEARKQKWAIEKEEASRRAPDPNCPRGMKLMPDEERVSTLEVLKQSKEEAMNQLSKMPFILETPTAKRKHASLEAKLKEIESAVALFSKTKVYVADSN